MLEKTPETQAGSSGDIANAILYCNAAAQDLHEAMDIDMEMK